jgi:hypothetical protein
MGVKANKSHLLNIAKIKADEYLRNILFMFSKTHKSFIIISFFLKIMHKRFFQEPTESQISNLRRQYAHDNLVERILSLHEGECLIITKPLIPDEFRDSWHFLRHGDKIIPTKRDTVRGVISGRTRPLNLLEAKCERLKAGKYAGCVYDPRDIYPYPWTDRRRRIVSLVECMEGDRIFNYAHQVLECGITIDDYSNSNAVSELGGSFHVKVPSRTQHHGRYRFNIESVPLVDNFQKYMVAWRTSFDKHDCLRDMYMSIGYPDEGQIYWCAHSIAAFYEILQKKGHISTQFSQMAFLTPFAIDFYKRLCDSTLIEYGGTRHCLNKAEKEIMSWGLVFKKSFVPTLGATSPSCAHDWSLRHV